MRGWLIASAAALVVASPVVLISIGQRSQVSWLKPLDAAQIASVRQLLGPPALAATVLLVTVATFAFCALRGRLATDVPSRLLALSLPWLLLPPAVLLAASAAHPVYSLRYIMFCAPAAALLAGAGLAALGWAGGAVGLALIVLVALPGQASDRRVGSHSENLRQLSHLVAVHRRPGDALLFPRLSDREFEAAYPAPYRPLRDLTLSQTPTQSATLLGTAAPHFLIRSRLASVHRLWVVETGNERGNVPLLNGLGFHEVTPLDSQRHLASALHPPRLRQAERYGASVRNEAGERPKGGAATPTRRFCCRVGAAVLLPGSVPRQSRSKGFRFQPPRSPPSGFPQPNPPASDLARPPRCRGQPWRDTCSSSTSGVNCAGGCGR